MTITTLRQKWLPYMKQYTVMFRIISDTTYSEMVPYFSCGWFGSLSILINPLLKTTSKSRVGSLRNQQYTNYNVPL